MSISKIDGLIIIKINLLKYKFTTPFQLRLAKLFAYVKINRCKFTRKVKYL